MSHNTPGANSEDPLEALVLGLSSRTAKVARKAREQLAASPDPRTTPRLLALLREQVENGAETPASWLVMWNVILLLGQRMANQDLPIADSRPTVRALLKLVEGRDSEVADAALQALAQAPAVPPKVEKLFGRKLRSPSSSAARLGLAGLDKLPPKARDKWVPAFLDRLKRFRNNSEWSWIVECLAPHFIRYRKRIEPVLRSGLKSDYPFAPRSVFVVLHQIGPTGASMIPDVLAYIARQSAFTDQEPHLIHLDPEGLTAVPELIRLLRHKSEPVRYQAASELGAYGPRARASVPALTALANATKGRELRLDADAAQRALAAIQQPVPNDPAPLPDSEKGGA